MSGAAFRTITDGELHTIADPAWLVDEMIPQDANGVLFGQRATFKSFIALDWALSVQTGMEWLGRKVKRGQAVYCAGEGWRGLKRRVAAWKQAREYNKDAGLLLVEGHSLRDEKTWPHFVKAINDKVEKPAFIALDTLARLLPGIKENDPELGIANTIADYFRSEFPNATVVWIHHAGWSGEHERGHTILGDAADFLYHAERVSETRRLTLSCTKQKDFDEPKPLPLEMLPLAGSLWVSVAGLSDGTRELLLRMAASPEKWSRTGVANWAMSEGVGRTSAYESAKRLKDLGYVIQVSGNWQLTPMALSALSGESGAVR